MRSLAARLARCTRGATAIEYGLIVSLVVIVLVVGVTTLSQSVMATWGGVSSKVGAVEP